MQSPFPLTPHASPSAAAFELYRTALTAEPASIATTHHARLARWAGHLATGAADLLYPPHCMACGTGLSGTAAFCMTCAASVQWIGHDHCRRCGAAVGAHRGAVESCAECASHPPAFVESVCAVARYGHPLRAVILGLKFGGGLQAVPLLTRLLETRLRITGLIESTASTAGSWIIVPVPLARADFLHRGFNQAEEIAAGLSRRLRIPLETRLLAKARTTVPQATLDHQARAGNLRGLFSCAPGQVARQVSKRVLLIDDVMTTGTTLSECARALHAAGFRHVRGAVVARG